MSGRTAQAAVLGAACAAVLAAGCSAGAGGASEEAPDPAPAPSAPDSPPPAEGAAQQETRQDAQQDAQQSGQEGRTEEGAYVFNTHGDEEGRPQQRPENLVASEFTSFTGLEWQEWGVDAAVGRGELSGTWCLPECQDDPYPATVELGDPENVGGTLYFTTYRVTEAEGLADADRRAMEDADQGMLIRP
ncbi:hypothetical protein [Nocardiopsis composta]|uniref:Lipoprotein n=1 Tax=Nocardiopsis composta TaxID=157465 RepID=A0A7W8VEG8_9ACTN|nr:hypothetical protein [Nocardiopsis composta]MBB5433090.1 hypothetical protein [Nocardiopsis composta]